MMQWIVLVVMGAPVALAMQVVSRLRARGHEGQAMRLYRRTSWALGLSIYIAMAVHEGVLIVSGLLNWQTGLPLHLCSMMGLLTLPMLLSGRPILWHLALYLGLPGATMALLFPSVVLTPWPLATELSFFVLHAGLMVAPLMPLYLGRRPSARGAAEAGVCILAVGLIMIAINDLLDSNYLFVNWAVPGTPLESISHWGIVAYRVLLAGLCVLVLAAEGTGVRLFGRLMEKHRES